MATSVLEICVSHRQDHTQLFKRNAGIVGSENLVKENLVRENSVTYCVNKNGKGANKGACTNAEVKRRKVFSSLAELEHEVEAKDEFGLTHTGPAIGF